MTLVMEATVPQLRAPIMATGSGSFTVASHTGSFDLGFHLPDLPQVRRQLGGDTLHMREIIERQTLYIGFPAALASRLPGGRPWLKVNLAQQAAAMGMPGLSAMSSSPFSSDPSQMMQFLHAVSGKVTKVGSGTVAGYHTTEYQATIQLDREAQLVPRNQRAAAQRAIKSLEALAHITQLPVYVWVDNSHRVRRIVLHMNMSVANSGSLTMALQATIPEYGPQPKPTLPPSSQVTNAASLQNGVSSTT